MNKLLNIFCITILLLFYGCEEVKIDVDTFGVITGRVLDGEDYSPIAGVQIVTNPPSSSYLSDDFGDFKIEKVPTGEVAITAKKKDFLSSTISVAVYENDTTDLVFYLLEDEGDVGWIVIYDPVPGNGAVDQDTSITFKWKVDQEFNDRILEYTVYYYESNSTVQYIAGENLTVEEVTVSGLNNSTTYYWYVVAKHDGLNVANSPTWTFKTQN